jgi:Protein of unknown function with HXXEE motif
MNYLRRHWYNIGLVITIGPILYLAFAWHDTTLLQRLLLLNFVALLVHQYEEYGFPGGFPAIANMVLRPSSSPDRYPLNQNAAMVLNSIFGPAMYLIPVFFPNVIWLGLAPALVGLMQFIFHGIYTNKKLGTFYNPGLAAVTLLHVPLGIYYIYYVQSTGIAGIWDWVIALVYVVFTVVVLFNQMTYKWLADKNSPYPFSYAEMRRWNVQEKVGRLKAGTHN